jgi:hypothetical protein
VARLVALCVVAVTVLAGLASAATTQSYSFHVVGASATVRLTYAGEAVAGRERTSGYANVTSTLIQTKGKARNGSLSRTGGRIAARLKIRTVERAKVSQRASDASPYVEQECANKATQTGSGGLAFSRLSGGRVQVRWAFPQANAVACPGPKGVGKGLAARMTRIVPAGLFKHARLTLSLSGAAPFSRGPYEGTYRWRATVALKRL